MCEPTTIGMILIGQQALSRISDSFEQEKINKFNAKQAEQNYAVNTANLSIEQMERKGVTTEASFKNSTESAENYGNTLVASVNQGVTGLSVDRLLNNIQNKEAMQAGIINRTDASRSVAERNKQYIAELDRDSTKANQKRPESVGAIVANSGLQMLGNYAKSTGNSEAKSKGKS